MIQNFDSNIITMIATVIMAIATGFYAYLTLIIVKETTKLREIQTQPQIIAYIQLMEESRAFFELIVRNIGGGTAYHVSWEFDLLNPIFQAKSVLMHQDNFFLKGVPRFEPGQKYKTIFGGVRTLLQMDPVTIPSLSLKVAYENKIGKKFMDEFVLNPDSLRGCVTTDDHGLWSIEQALLKIESQIGRLQND